MVTRARLTFYWQTRPVDVVEIPALDAVNNYAYVSIQVPGWREERGSEALTIVDDAGDNYALEVEAVSGRGMALTLNGYVRRVATASRQ